MTDYIPINLSRLANVGVEAFGSGRSPRTGLQQFRGLPFLIPDGSGSCFIGLGREMPASATSIPIGQTATHIIFASSQLDCFIEQGDLPGRVLGNAAFFYSDGTCVEVAIRQRFETMFTPMPWGMLPFASQPDGSDGVMDRNGGPWSEAGNRQQEVAMAWPHDYFLWDWKNPYPDREVARVDVSAVLDDGQPFPVPRFIIAAVTVSKADEDPLVTCPAATVKLTLPDDADAAPPFSIEVKVDRGLAGFAFALPEQPTEEYIEDDLAGFGQEQSEKNSPAYVEITATPSATVSVEKSGETLAQVRWGELADKERVDAGRVRLEVIGGGRNWVHTSVVDEDTGKQLPCRIHFRSAEGVPYAPHGHHSHVNTNHGSWHIDVGGDVRLAQSTYAYIDGRCQGWLPRGEVIVDVARGYEYEPLRQRVTIEPGQRNLTLRIKRRVNMNAEGYYSGDTHVHFLSSQGALLEAAGEDLDVVNLLQSQWGHLFTNVEEFTGKPHISGDGETIVYASQENRQHILGHLSLLGLKEPVMPWCSDGPGEAELGGTMETTLSHWADACHAQGGTVVIPHMPNPNAEPAALIATGRADAVELLTHNPFFYIEYYRYLNGGYRLPIAGGTDKMDAGVPVGMYRTYAHISPEEGFTYDNWLKALRGGNTFLSSGPLLSLSVDGHAIGSTIQLGRDGGQVEVRASATSIFPIHSLQIVMNGEVVASADDALGSKMLSVSEKLNVERSSWICARVAGPGHSVTLRHFDSWRRGICGHTSPVYLSVGPKYDVFSESTMHYMMTLVQGSLEHIRRSRQHAPGTVTHHHGSADHMEYLEGPLHEAAAAIHRRMHEHGIAH